MPEERKTLVQRLISLFAPSSTDASRSLPASVEKKNPELSRIFQNLVEGVLAVDDKGAVTELNPAFCGIFELDRDKGLGRSFLEVVRNARLETLRQECLRSRSLLTEEVVLLSPQERTFEAQWIPLLDGEAISGSVLVLHEITRLRELEKLRQEFVANVSHELRTPLAAVKGFAETLFDGAVDDKKNRMEFLQAIIRHTDRLTALVSDLLSLSAIESGRERVTPEPLDISSVVNHIVEGLKPLAKQYKVELRQVSSRSWNIATDKGYLQQILTNLITNAIQYNKDKGFVEIDMEGQSGFLKIFVRDSGLGIPSEDLPRIFERFYRVDKDRSREHGGTGLGLSLVKHMVELLGGQVGVESELDKGSTFWFNLPI